MEMPSSKSMSGRNVLIAFFVFVLTIAVFSPSLTAELVRWDDDINILENPHIQKIDAESLTWMFTDSSYTPRYRPLNWLSWAVLYHFFGLNPFPYHALTLAMHGVNAALLFFVIARLIQRARNQPLSTRETVFCAMATLVWALHPLRVEAVTWVNCQIYTQSFFFLLIATLLYLRAAVQERPIATLPYWGAVGLFLCSLLTYPTAVAFAVLLLAIDFFPLKRLDLSNIFSARNRNVFIEKIPFAVLTLLIGGMALWARSNATGVWSEVLDSSRLSLPDKAAQAFYIWAYYLWKPFAFLDLSPVYTQLVQFKWTEWPFLASATSVIAISALLVWRRRQQPVLLCLWVCYLALLVPMLGLTEHPHYPNDRYSYLASALFSVSLGAVLVNRTRGRFIPVLNAVMGVVIVCLAAFSVRQVQVWQNSYTLFDSVLTRLGDDPYCSDVLYRLGRAYAGEGRFEDAIDAYKIAITVEPKFTKAHVDLATVYMQTGRAEEAIGHYREALRIKPTDALANYNLGVVLEKAGNVAETLSCYRTAVQSEPHNLDYRFALAAALGRSGQQAESLAELKTALRIGPTSPDAHCKLGSALAAQQRMPEAIDHFRKAIQLKPTHGEAHYNLGTALAISGKVPEATPHFLEAARLQPKVPQAHLACGMALTESGRSADAVASYRTALKLQPDLMPAIVNLGWILSANRDPKVRNGAEAISLAQSALKIAGEKHPEAFDLLAAAYAEAGKWDEAVKAAQRASTLAAAEGRGDLSADLERKMKLYASGQPFRM